MSESKDITMQENFNTLVTPEVEIPRTVTPQAAFIAKCIHPPSAVNGFAGLPTLDTRSQVTAEYKGVKLMEAPGYLNISSGVTAPAKHPTSFCYLIPGGGSRVPFISFFRDTDNGTWYQDIPNTTINSVYDIKNRLANDVNLYRPCYKSVTTMLNVTMFNDTGMVAGCQFNPPLLFAGTLSELADKHPAHFRGFVRSNLHLKTVRASKSKYYFSWPKHLREDIADQVNRYFASTVRGGRITTIAEAFDDLQIINPDPEIIDLDPSAPIQFVYFGACSDTTDPIPTFDQILNIDTRSACYPAKEGTFTVNHLNTIAPAWLVPGPGKLNTPAGGLFACYFCIIGKDGAYHFVPFNEPAPLGTPYANVQVLVDSQWSSDMTWNWVQYQGLSYNSSQDTVTLQQLIALKWIIGLEFQPSALSPFAGMQKLSPKPDLKAMESLLVDFYDLKSVLPARYNFLGMLARGAMKLMPTITKNFKPIMNALRGVSDFADDDSQRVIPKKNKPQQLMQNNQQKNNYQQPRRNNNQRRPPAPKANHVAEKLEEKIVADVVKETEKVVHPKSSKPQGRLRQQRARNNRRRRN